MKLLNAFSANMLAAFPADVRFVEKTAHQVRDLLVAGTESCVGHADTANVFAAELGIPVSCARATVALNKGEAAVLGQYVGPRLPEGATTLPAGATIKWLLVTVA